MLAEYGRRGPYSNAEISMELEFLYTKKILGMGVWVRQAAHIAQKSRAIAWEKVNKTPNALYGDTCVASFVKQNELTIQQQQKHSQCEIYRENDK